MQLALFPETPPGPGALGRVRDIVYRDARSILTRATVRGAGYDWHLNPYRGCAFACDYCFARFFAPDEDLRARWGEWVEVKANAIALVRRAIAGRTTPRLLPSHAIFMSSATDPYQPIERQLELTRGVVEALLAIKPALTVQTRSPLVTRDLDLLRLLPRARVNLSIPTDDDAVRRRYEPHAPSIAARLRAAEQIQGAGVALGISISPMLPLNDARAFGRRLAALGAAKYVSTQVRLGRGAFVTNTPKATVARLRGEGWDDAAFARARAELAEGLAPATLFGDAAGFGPEGAAEAEARRGGA